MLHGLSESIQPHRLVFFAEGGGGGSAESYRPEEGGEAKAGVSEAALEAAAQERQQAGLAAKRQKKEERKMKRREFRLAEIIRFFIQGAQADDKMAILLSRLVKSNVPVNVILAVLTLVYDDVVSLLEDYLEEERDILPDEDLFVEKPIEVDTKALIPYGEELTQNLSTWTKRIFTNASFHPMKTVLALARHHGVDHNMIQLSSLMIQRYFEGVQHDVEFSRIQSFSEHYWRNALKKLHQIADERGLLPEPEDDPIREDDEDLEEEEEI